jgi:hypothetical protein
MSDPLAFTERAVRRVGDHHAWSRAVPQDAVSSRHAADLARLEEIERRICRAWQECPSQAVINATIDQILEEYSEILIRLAPMYGESVRGPGTPLTRPR